MKALPFRLDRTYFIVVSINLCKIAATSARVAPSWGISRPSEPKNIMPLSTAQSMASYAYEGRLLPANIVTRAEVAQVLYNLFAK